MCENSLRDVTINDCVLRRLSLCHYILDQAQVRTTDFSWGIEDLTQLWPPKQATQATHLHIRPKQKQKKQCVPEQERTNKPEVFFFSTFLQHLISTPNLSCSPHSSFFSPPSVVHMLLYFCRGSPAPDVVPVCCYVFSSQPPVTG